MYGITIGKQKHQQTQNVFQSLSKNMAGCICEIMGIRLDACSTAKQQHSQNAQLFLNILFVYSFQISAHKLKTRKIYLVASKINIQLRNAFKFI